ncbi:RNA polymerase sigma factor [Streptomyces mauvecolor]
MCKNTPQSDIPPTALTDAELTASMRASDGTAALTELYVRHRPMVSVYAHRHCRDPHTAEDLVSEAFTQTIRAVRAGAGPESSWRPYLLVAVRNAAAAWDVAARRVELSDDLENRLGRGAAASKQDDGEESAMRREDTGLVFRGFRSLPHRWQAVLWHTVVERESTAAVGALLGLTASGVTSLAARAREALREAYLAAHAQEAAGNEVCLQYAPLIAAVLRRPRPGSRQIGLLETHLSGCVGCRRAMKDLTALNQQLHAPLA